MSSEEAANGKKSHWVELEISGKTCKQKFMAWKLRYGRKLFSNANTQGKQCYVLPVLIYLRSWKFQQKEHGLCQSSKPIHCLFSHYQCPFVKWG